MTTARDDRKTPERSDECGNPGSVMRAEEDGDLTRDRQLFSFCNVLDAVGIFIPLTNGGHFWLVRSSISWFTKRRRINEQEKVKSDQVLELLSPQSTGLQ